MRRTPTSAHSDPPPRFLTTLRFVVPGNPDLLVNTLDCPKGTPAYRHWNDDGTCKCPKEET